MYTLSLVHDGAFLCRSQCEGCVWGDSRRLAIEGDASLTVGGGGIRLLRVKVFILFVFCESLVGCSIVRRPSAYGSLKGWPGRMRTAAKNSVRIPVDQGTGADQAILVPHKRLMNA